jgi:hypothetical protein
LSVPLNRSKPSLASVVACMMPFMMGVCFLCPSMDCLWHKYHYCPSCGEKVLLSPYSPSSVLSRQFCPPRFFTHLVLNSAGGRVQEVRPVPRGRCDPVVRAKLRRACVVHTPLAIIVPLPSNDRMRCRCSCVACI